MGAARKRRAEDIESSAPSAIVPPLDSKTDSLSRQCLSVVFRDKRLRVSDDRMSVSSSFSGNGDNGYSSIIATSSACTGRWYFEVIVEELGENSHFRVGWSTRRTRFDTPLGSDCFSYAIRDTDCARVTLGRRWDTDRTGSSPIRVGDVVGCLLELPNTVRSPRIVEDPLTFFPNLLCDPENVGEPELFDPVNEGKSSIMFYINGKPLTTDPAFTNLVKGEYYPAVSLFGKCKVRFDFEPQRASAILARPSCEMFIPASMIKPKKRPTNFIPRGLMSSGA
jgi:hypothetical protein